MLALVLWVAIADVAAPVAPLRAIPVDKVARVEIFAGAPMAFGYHPKTVIVRDRDGFVRDGRRVPREDVAALLAALAGRAEANARSLGVTSRALCAAARATKSLDLMPPPDYGAMRRVACDPAKAKLEAIVDGAFGTDAFDAGIVSVQLTLEGGRVIEAIGWMNNPYGAPWSTSPPSKNPAIGRAVAALMTSAFGSLRNVLRGEKLMSSLVYSAASIATRERMQKEKAAPTGR